jgi:hypothetical protein
MTNPERIAAYPADHPRAWTGIIAVLPAHDGPAYDAAVERLTATYGPIVPMSWEDWRQGAIAAQAAVIACWEPCDPEHANEMLEVLPPIAWDGGSFCVGEPDDHDFATGRPRYIAYRQHATSAFRSSRPVTVAELQANRSRAPRQPWTVTR